MSKENSVNDKAPSCDILDILVATDVHLGYNEKDPERGDDSFNSFEEILKIAQSKEVDLVLLGGDLFHENKPSPKCIHRCLKLLRQYCLGDRPIRVEFLSDQSENFRHCDFPVVNYEDPNYSISIPVFSIHGNHDDPSGYGRLSSLDICSVTNLVNYFGKWTNLKKIEISPILLRKGITNVAIYGLSYIKDDRLARLFNDERVIFWQPQQDADSWFNIFMCHQNRNNRGENKYLPEEAIPPFIDFVIWGHEHECRITEEFNGQQAFYVTQPGSPVATSLCEGEAKPKHIGLLQIHKQHHKFTPIKLQTVRPFVFDTVVLSEQYLEYGKETTQENVEAFLKDKVQQLLDAAKEQVSGHEKQPKLPLIRLRAEWNSEDQIINTIRFGQLYYLDVVANPTNMLLMRKQKSETKRKVKGIDENMMDEILEEEVDNVQSVLEKYFSEVDGDKKLKILSVKGLGEAVSRYVDRGDKTAVEDLQDHQVKRTINFLKKRENINDETIYEEIEEYRLARLEKAKDELQEAREVLESADRSKAKVVDDDKIISDKEEDGNDSDFNDLSVAATAQRAGRGKRGRGKAETAPRSRARGAKGTRGAASATRAAKQTSIVSSLSARTPASRSTNRTRIAYSEISDSD